MATVHYFVGEVASIEVDDDATLDDVKEALRKQGYKAPDAWLGIIESDATDIPKGLFLLAKE